MLTMYARKKIDITWMDIWNLLWSFLFTHHKETGSEVEAELNNLWSPDQTLTTFTVRSGFDLCLQACSFSPGSEVIVSAVTIPDMISIIEHHGLLAVPVDIQEDGSVAVRDILSLITPKTTAILIAHLFGNRMPFSGIAREARKRGLFVFEDCAEAFSGTEYTGCSDANVSMFSFGLIKTSTALGGGILTIRDRTILQSVKSIQGDYPQQSRSDYLLRLAKYCGFKALTDSPYLYASFLSLLHHFGINHHIFIRRVSRSFAAEDLMRKIKQRPSQLNLQLLLDRVSYFTDDKVLRRRQRVERLAMLLPREIHPLAFGEEHHQYWLCPIRVGNPLGLSKSLYDAGFDSADGGTSLAVVSVKGVAKPRRAESIMRQVLYLPMDHEFGTEEITRLARVIHAHLDTEKSLEQ